MYDKLTSQLQMPRKKRLPTPVQLMNCDRTSVSIRISLLFFFYVNCAMMGSIPEYKLARWHHHFCHIYIYIYIYILCTIEFDILATYRNILVFSEIEGWSAKIQTIFTTLLCFISYQAANIVLYDHAAKKTWWRSGKFNKNFTMWKLNTLPAHSWYFQCSKYLYRQSQFSKTWNSECLVLNGKGIRH